MSATSVPTPEYVERLYMHRGEAYFTVVVCPHCKLNCRLLWPARLTAYPKGTFESRVPCGLDSSRYTKRLNQRLPVYAKRDRSSDVAKGAAEFSFARRIPSPV